MFAWAADAQEVRIGVLGLFHPTMLKISAEGREVELRLGSADRTFRGPVTVEVPGKVRRTYHGSLSVRSFQGELHSVVTLRLEDAVAASAQAEAPHSHPEAQKVQRVLARSYYTAERRRHVEFDFCDTTHCQLFQDPA